ncbi:MAG: peptidoglycan endopeptidase [Flavobacterium sp.]|nr:MAG: peptidoglycan endopeptidase [Flavobacterium sp.]
MQKKILLILALFIASLTNAQVVTSKKEAIKKGIYEKPSEKVSQQPALAVNTPQKNISKPVVQKPAAKPVAKKKKIVIDDSGDEDLIVDGSDNYLTTQMINNAMTFLGVNYRGGGTTVAGMDCSGMVTAVFNIFGLKLPRSSHEMAKVGEKLRQDEIKKGDLVFFRTLGGGISHVGMVVDIIGDEIKFIHSSTQKGVIISSTKEPYYQRTFVQANRVIM